MATTTKSTKRATAPVPSATVPQPSTRGGEQVGGSVVDEVLSTDHKYRYDGVEADLHVLSDLKPKSWDFSKPTLVRDDGDQHHPSSSSSGDLTDDSFRNALVCTNVREFKDAFESTHPVLKGVALDHLLVAGGSVGRIVRPPPPEPAVPRNKFRSRRHKGAGGADDSNDPVDVDLFVYGLKSRKDANLRVHRLLNDVMKSLRNERDVRRRIREYLFAKRLADLHPHEKLMDDEKLRADRIKALTKPQQTAIRTHVRAQMKHIRFVWNAQRNCFVVDSEMVKKWLAPPGLDSYHAPIIELTRSDDCLTISFRGYCVPVEDDDGVGDRSSTPQNDADCKKKTKKTKKKRSKGGDDGSSAAAAGGSWMAPRLSGRVCSGKIQIIFRLYHSISEVLHGFDLGSSAIGYDGNQVWLTSLSRFAYEYGCNIVDVRRRSPTYEARLIKYFTKRGFHLILPDLDLTRWPTKNLKWGLSEAVDLPFLPFALRSVSENRLVVDRFLRRDNAFGSMSDYDPTAVGKNGGVTVVPARRLLLKLNLQRALQKAAVPHFFFFSDQYVATSILLAKPHITVQMVQTYYDDARSRVYRNGRVNLVLLRQVVTVEAPETVLTRMVHASETKGKVCDVLDELFQKQRVAAVAAVKAMPTRYMIPWRAKSPGAQLTSSLEPTPCTPREWYGVYYKSESLSTLDPALEEVD